MNGATVDTPYGGYNFADRKDYFDATVGARVRLGDHVALAFTGFRRINDDGARPEGWSPVASLEGYF